MFINERSNPDNCLKLTYYLVHFLCIVVAIKIGKVQSWIFILNCFKNPDVPILSYKRNDLS